MNSLINPNTVAAYTHILHLLNSYDLSNLALIAFAVMAFSCAVYIRDSIISFDSNCIHISFKVPTRVLRNGLVAFFTGHFCKKNILHR